MFISSSGMCDFSPPTRIEPERRLVHSTVVPQLLHIMWPDGKFPFQSINNLKSEDIHTCEVPTMDAQSGHVHGSCII